MNNESSTLCVCFVNINYISKLQRNCFVLKTFSFSTCTKLFSSSLGPCVLGISRWCHGGFFRCWLLLSSSASAMLKSPPPVCQLEIERNGETLIVSTKHSPYTQIWVTNTHVHRALIYVRPLSLFPSGSRMNDSLFLLHIQLCVLPFTLMTCVIYCWSHFQLSDKEQWRCIHQYTSVANRLENWRLTQMQMHVCAMKFNVNDTTTQFWFQWS